MERPFEGDYKCAIVSLRDVLIIYFQADESFDSNNSDDDEEDTGDVAMVPMADMLNALVEHDNVMNRGFLSTPAVGQQILYRHAYSTKSSRCQW